MNAVHQGDNPPKGELPLTIAELKKQVILMEDIQEIENLQKIYGYYFEIGNYQGVVDLFSEDAESVEIKICGLLLGKAGVNKMYVDTIGSNKCEPWIWFCIHRLTFMTPYEKGWIQEPVAASIAGSPANTPDKPTTYHMPYCPYRINVMQPPPPKPYED
jgi:hypothetical protein